MRIALPLHGEVLPPRGSPARLPVLLMPVLIGAVMVQLAWPEHIDVPPAGVVATVGLVAPPAAPPVVVAPPLLASRDLFAPLTRGTGTDGSGDPLGGAVIAGVVQKGRVRLGVVQQPGGKLRYVAVGSALGSWQLVALEQGEARLTRVGGEHLLVPYGGHAAPPKPPDPPPPIHAKSPQTAGIGQ